MGYDWLLFACFAAVLGRLDWKKYALAVPAAVACWCAPWFFTTYNRTIFLSKVYMNSYGDIPAGVLFGGAVALWLALRAADGPRWPVVPVLAFAALAKDNLFPVMLVAAGMAAADWFFFPDSGPSAKAGPAGWASPPSPVPPRWRPTWPGAGISPVWLPSTPPKAAWVSPARACPRW